MQKPKLLYKCWIAQSIVSTSFEAITVLPKTNVALKNCSWICKAADILSSGRVLNVPCVLLPLLICLVVFSYTGAGVVRQRAVVGQGDVFLLPLLIQRAPTSLPQDALSKKKKKKTNRGHWNSQENKANLTKYRVDTTETSSSKSNGRSCKRSINRSAGWKRWNKGFFCAAYVRWNK